jgi:hypothetical protein
MVYRVSCIVLLRKKNKNRMEPTRDERYWYGSVYAYVGYVYVYGGRDSMPPFHIPEGLAQS